EIVCWSRPRNDNCDKPEHRRRDNGALCPAQAVPLPAHDLQKCARTTRRRRSRIRRWRDDCPGVVRQEGNVMSRQRASFVAVGFLGGVAAGTLVWSRMQRNYRRKLFSRHAFRRVAALGYLRALPSLTTPQLRRELLAGAAPQLVGWPGANT